MDESEFSPSRMAQGRGPVFHPSLEDPSFLKNLALAGGFLYVYAFGAGAYSFDAKRGKA